jgi:acyl carrier protein
MQFRELLQQVKERVAEALAWQFVPISAVISEVCAGGDASRPPLYQTMFSYRNGGSSFDLHRLCVTPRGQRYAPVPTELSVEIEDGPADVKLICQYNIHIFDRSTIERFTASFDQLVAAAAAAPDARLCELQMLDEALRRDILYPRNETCPVFNEVNCVSKLDEVQRSDDRDTPAMTGTEILLREMWQEVLEVEDVGVHDNFFDLGGQSLVATRLMMRIRDRLGVRLSMHAVFEAPTVRDLARVIERRGRK